MNRVAAAAQRPATHSSQNRATRASGGRPPTPIGKFQLA